MIYIARCPYRVSLLGGGSDLSWWNKEVSYGLCLGFSINKYTHVVLSPKSIGSLGILNYSSREIYESLDLIAHPIIRAVFDKFNLNTPVELTSFGSEINGAGMGGSSSFSNALISSILRYQGVTANREEIAEYSCDIEINRLKKPIGKQDQYLTSLGGFRFLKFMPNGKVENIYEFSEKENLDFEKYVDSLVLVKMDMNRSASSVLENIKRDKEKSSEEIKYIRDNASIYLEHLKNKNCFDSKLLDELINESWERKRALPGVLNDALEIAEKKLKEMGLHMIKLLGAGGGGSFLCRPHEEKSIFIKKIKKIGYNSTSISVDKEGLKTIEF